MIENAYIKYAYIKYSCYMANPFLSKSLLIGSFSVRIFDGNGPIRVFLFWSEAGKFKIWNQNSEKKVWILSFFTLKLLEDANKIEFFRNFNHGWRRQTFLNASHRKCILLSERECHIIINLLTLLRLVRTATTSGQYSPVQPSRLVSNRLISYLKKDI